MPFDLKAIALVSAGAVAGALLRFGISSALPSHEIWATLAINLAGSFAIGLLLLPDGTDHALRLWAVVGFLGSFTTLSAYSFQTVDLLRSGRTWLAVANVLGNGLGGPLVAFLGWKIKG